MPLAPPVTTAVLPASGCQEPAHEAAVAHDRVLGVEVGVPVEVDDDLVDARRSERRDLACDLVGPPGGSATMRSTTSRLAASRPASAAASRISAAAGDELAGVDLRQRLLAEPAVGRPARRASAPRASGRPSGTGSACAGGGTIRMSAGSE